MCREAQLCAELSVCTVEQRHQRPSSPHITPQSSIIWWSQTCCFYRCNSAAGRGQMGCWARGRGGGGWGLLKHTLQHRLGSWSGLSCKACTGISCNSLSYTDRGEGWKMLSLPALFPCLPKSGWKNECREHRERAYWRGKGGEKKLPPSATLLACATFGYLQKQLLTQSLAAHFICALCLK